METKKMNKDDLITALRDLPCYSTISSGVDETKNKTHGLYLEITTQISGILFVIRLKNERNKGSEFYKLIPNNGKGLNEILTTIKTIEETSEYPLVALEIQKVASYDEVSFRGEFYLTANIKTTGKSLIKQLDAKKKEYFDAQKERYKTYEKTLDFVCSRFSDFTIKTPDNNKKELKHKRVKNG